MPYGHLEGEARERAQKELDARYAEIEDEVLCCVKCTNTRKKARKENKVLWRKAMCIEHGMAKRIAYNTSPLSETYWTS